MGPYFYQRSFSACVFFLFCRDNLLLILNLKTEGRPYGCPSHTPLVPLFKEAPYQLSQLCSLLAIDFQISIFPYLVRNMTKSL